MDNPTSDISFKTPINMHMIFTKIFKEDRVIAGYASTEIIDSQGDLIPVKAIEEAFKLFTKDWTFALVNLMHTRINVGRVIPEYTDSDGTVYKSGVTDTGLFVVVKLRTDIKKANEAWELIEKGTLRGFSISGEALIKVTVCSTETGKCYERIDKLELHEISIVDRPANKLCLFDILKHGSFIKMNNILQSLPMIVLEKGIVKLGNDIEKPHPRSNPERARSHFDISEDKWNSMSAEERQRYIDKLPERGSAEKGDPLLKPVPSPREGESHDKFMPRCLSALADADPDRPNKQRVAMCYTAWREKHPSDKPPKKSELEDMIYVELYKQFESNGLLDLWENTQVVHKEDECPCDWTDLYDLVLLRSNKDTTGSYSWSDFTVVDTTTPITEDPGKGDVALDPLNQASNEEKGEEEMEEEKTENKPVEEVKTEEVKEEVTEEVKVEEEVVEESTEEVKGPEVDYISMMAELGKKLDDISRRLDEMEAKSKSEEKNEVKVEEVEEEDIEEKVEKRVAEEIEKIQAGQTTEKKSVKPDEVLQTTKDVKDPLRMPLRELYMKEIGE